MSRGRKIGLIAGIAAIAIAVFIVMRIIGMTDVLVEPVARQLAALKAGNMEAAYAETSEEFRTVTSQDEFTAFVNEYPALKDASDYSFPRRSFENDQGHIEGSITSSTGEVTPVAYDLRKEKGAWKIVFIGVNTTG